MVHWNNSFINGMQLSLLREKSGTILLVLMVLMAARQADSLAGSQMKYSVVYLLIASLGFSWH